jgi:hypothetical protein
MVRRRVSEEMDMVKGLIVGTLTAAVSFGAFAGASNVSSSKLIKEATVAYKQVAKDTSYQWTTTVKSIKAAQAAFDKGKYTQAEALAREALELVDATRTQAKIEAETWQMRVPK